MEERNNPKLETINGGEIWGGAGVKEAYILDIEVQSYEK